MTLPPATLTLEEEEAHFYAAFGKALTQWEAVETGLANIFCAVVGPLENSGLANIAFYSVISFGAKMDMTNNVVATRYGPSIAPIRAAEWSELYNRTVKRSKKRNRLAHFGVEVDRTRPPGYRFHLCPSRNSLFAVEQFQYNPPAYNICQITAFGNAFEKLASGLMEFWEKIRPMRQLTSP